MAKTDVLEFSKEKQGYSCEFISVGKCVIQIDREYSGILSIYANWKVWIMHCCINTLLLNLMIM